jgi:hypothetical protein
MPPMNGSFDASQFQPRQVGEGHPVGKYPAKISSTAIEPTKDGTGGMFTVEFTTPSGSIKHRYNLWNKEPKAVEIAHGQLSALCHATGIFRLDWGNEGASLREGQCTIDVGYQKGQEPSAENPGGGYVEVKKVLDRNGNEPGKTPTAQPQPAQQWTPPAKTEAPPANPAPGGWTQPASANPTTAGATGGWPQAQPQTQQAPPQNNPPWAQK